MMWFARDWAGHVARSTAEISESLAQALVDAGVAEIVPASEAADGLDEPEPEPEPKARRRAQR